MELERIINIITSVKAELEDMSPASVVADDTIDCLYGNLIRVYSETEGGSLIAPQYTDMLCALKSRIEQLLVLRDEFKSQVSYLCRC